MLERKQPRDLGLIELPEEVIHELRTFVSLIANTYRENFFHNFGTRNGNISQ